MNGDIPPNDDLLKQNKFTNLFPCRNECTRVLLFQRVEEANATELDKVMKVFES
jgi:hypothetical protein